MRDDASVPKIGNTMSPMAREVRKLVLLDRARTALGGGKALADAMGVGVRAVNHKLSADRGLSDVDLALVAHALDVQAAWVTKLADDVRAMIGGGA